MRPLIIRRRALIPDFFDRHPAGWMWIIFALALVVMWLEGRE